MKIFKLIFVTIWWIILFIERKERKKNHQEICSWYWLWWKIKNNLYLEYLNSVILIDLISFRIFLFLMWIIFHYNQIIKLIVVFWLFLKLKYFLKCISYVSFRKHFWHTFALRKIEKSKWLCFLKFMHGFIKIWSYWLRWTITWSLSLIF
jgi:hypothetical protein